MTMQTMQTGQMTTIDLLTGYLPRYGWPGFQVVEDAPEGGKILTGWHSQFVAEARVMFITVDHKANLLHLIVPALAGAPQDQMPIGQLADVLTAIGFANYALPLGSFEYDPRDGEIRFSVGFPIDDSAISFEQFQHLLNGAQAAVTYWAGRLKDVAGGKRTGDAVVESFLGHAREFAGQQ